MLAVKLDCELISLLRYFNRKERFFLIGQALGNKNFTLSEEFRSLISKKLNLDIPKDAFAAMDYHLDWIYASLYCSDNGTIDLITDNNFKLNSNQEDIDFIIAYREDNTYHLLLIEAKAESGWTNKQMASKANKLKSILGETKLFWKNVKVYFLITSPRKPLNLRVDILPTYLQQPIENLWFKLELPEYLIKITRCDEGGNSCKEGSKWKVERT